MSESEAAPAARVATELSRWKDKAPPPMSKAGLPRRAAWRAFSVVNGLAID